MSGLATTQTEPPIELKRTVQAACPVGFLIRA